MPKNDKEYNKVKNIIIEQIKLIHKYNLLKKDTFGLMLDNSKYEELAEINKMQKEKIEDLENKMYNIFQKMLTDNTSSKKLGKLNKNLSGYIDNLKSIDTENSLVNTEKLEDLIDKHPEPSKKKTIKKIKKKPAKSPVKKKPAKSPVKKKPAKSPVKGKKSKKKNTLNKFKKRTPKNKQKKK
jgi:hypothetical protein